MNTIEIFVNGRSLELKSQNDINVSMNAILFDPTSLSFSQSDYSFEFQVPSTPINDQIFDYANNLSKLNKFNIRYDAQLIANGIKIFDGQLILKKYKDKLYTCNFVAIKTYSLDDIFGDALLKDLDWKIDFSGATTINSTNANDNGEYYFPFVSYGVFQKVPYYKDPDDSQFDEYTSKFKIDQYNRFWVESFPPSHNLLTTVKKCFEHKGYTVGGNAFNDPILRNIYMSVNLADDQSPIYNIGNPLFGDLSVTASFNNANKAQYMYPQDLKYPYRKVETYMAGQFITEYNFPTIDYWNLLDNNIATKSMSHNSYMFDPDENVIVIPASGFYRITMTANMAINNPMSSFQASQKTKYWGNDGKNFDDTNETFYNQLTGETPAEIQLVKNPDGNIELIKGKNNVRWLNGKPYTSIREWTENGQRYVLENKQEWLTCYPHQNLGVADNPTEGSDNSGGIYSYVYANGETMAFDQYVSPAFICGLSSMSNGVASVVKNGRSWNRTNADVNEVFANVQGYSKLFTTTNPNGSQSQITAPSNVNFNNFVNAPIDKCTASDSTMVGNVCCTVYLEKNDILKLLLVQRDFDGEQKYSCNGQVSLHIEAVSPLSKRDDLAAEHYNYASPTTFDDKLNLANWLNKETTMKDFVDNAVKALNLQLIQDGNNIYLEKKRKIIDNKYINYAVDIDDRVNSYSSDIETEMIDYPKSLAVKYKIDTDEWGFEKSVTPQSKLNDDDWKDYGDYGYTEVKLNENLYATKKEEISTNFSYTWYDTFDKNGTFLKIPVISKYKYMIDGYSYSDSMKYDGYGLTQRMWYRNNSSAGTISTASLPAETIRLYLPVNEYNGVNLSYKNDEVSLLTEYFNLTVTTESNMVNVDVRLTPKEYFEVKNGAMIHMDEDLYYVAEVEGYDPVDGQCSLKLVKKII